MVFGKGKLRVVAQVVGLEFDRNGELEVNASIGGFESNTVQQIQFKFISLHCFQLSYSTRHQLLLLT